MITLDNIGYAYHHYKTALENVSANIGKGFHLLLGENGAGKTTLLHVTSGLLTPQHGACIIDGENVASRRPSTLENIYFLPDTPHIIMPTINEMAKFHAPFYQGFSDTTLHDCLSAFNLSGNENLARLSLGDRKKSFIAYAISLNTPILLLDEPANGLDIDSKKALQKMFARHIGDDRTMIISTHTIWDFQNLFDGVIMLNRAHLLVALPVWQITERIAFVKTPEESPEALYCEHGIGCYNAMLPNNGQTDTDIDFNLLYTGLRSNRATQILSLLNN